MLVLPPRDPSLRPRRAFGFHRAGRARRRPVAPQLLAILLIRVSVREALAGGAPIGVLVGEVDKVLLPEAALGLGAGSHFQAGRFEPSVAAFITPRSVGFGARGEGLAGAAAASVAAAEYGTGESSAVRAG